MGTANDLAMGSMLAQNDKTNRLLEEQNNILSDNNKNAIIAEMRRTGMLLPEYDWQSREFQDAREAITADWFKRHPETVRGSGAFQKEYPDKNVALEMLVKMSGMGRITPEEYLVLHREMFNF